MLELNFDPFPVLETERLILRKLIPEDEQEVFAMRTDERVMRHIDRPVPQTLEEVRAFIEKILGQIEDNDAILWVITQKNSHTYIGSLGFWNIAKTHYRAEIGAEMHPDFQGKGIMTEAMAAIVDYGFSTMKLHSIEANASAQNLASIRVLEKLGFVREGYFRENYFFRGDFIDSVLYSLINSQD